MATIWIRGLGPMYMANSIGSAGCRAIHWPTSTRRSPSTVAHQWPVRQSLRVLVVEDQDDTADAAVWLVRRWGHAGYFAPTSTAALQIAAVRDPDVVLLDMEMPLIDGNQLARQLRSDSPGRDCFIVACAERVNDSLRRQCTRSGINLLLMKPFDPAVLELLLVLECELVNRSRTDNDSAAKAQCLSPWRDGCNSSDNPRKTRGSPC